MNYVELLRMRRNLAWYAGPMLLLTLIAIVSIHMNLSHLHAGHLDHGDGLDAGALAGVALATTLIFATVIGGTLSRENETPEMLRTKPFPRERIALSYVLTDAAAILTAFVIGCVLSLVVVFDLSSVVGGVLPPFHFTSGTALVVVLGLGVAFMWYALVQAVSSGLRARGGTVIGLSWATFTILIGINHLTFLPQAVQLLILGLNLLNPLAYMNTLHAGGGMPSAASIFALDPWTRAAIVWTIAIAACAFATFNWKRLEF